MENMDEVRQRMNSPKEILELENEISGKFKKSDFRNLKVSGLTSDSRRVSSGNAFFALPGIRSNGNDFVDEAVRRGAKVIITEDDKIEIPSSAVKNMRRIPGKPWQNMLKDITARRMNHWM